MAKNHSPRFLAIVNDAKQKVKETNVPAVQQKLAAGEKFHLIDVREDHEWSAGHLPGAIHLGKGIIERDIEKVVPNPDDPIVLYCGGGFRSALAANALVQMGYTNVLSMDGGFSGWKGAGNEVVTG
jgi:rhodanese-related sulfurtransferase